ncbi:unnamed protein product [Thelazia callipaeda]|uniref:Adenosine 3'-phospho 5'-phosphosulfate transporter 2 n=1 Tax=Thelazia callipaeda TaxID=103827 RepID=A0A0N5D171_THECL|nr:unnamed protein product [Thelazia callipaeda]
MAEAQLLPSIVDNVPLRQKELCSDERIKFTGIDLTARSKKFQFVVLCCAVFIFYIAYGFIQELMFKLDGMQSYGWHLTLIQFFICSLLSYFENLCYGGSSRRIPINIYLQLAAFTVGTIGFSNVAVSYLNYPTQVIFKCCKLVPVLIGGIIIQNKQYSWIDFVAACVMSFGLAVFILGDSKVSPMFDPFGYTMLSVALVFDAVIGNIQEKTLRTYKATNNEMILYSYFIGSVYIFLGLFLYGNFSDGFIFFSKQPLLIYGYSILFSISGYLGLNTVLSLVRTQGALIAVTVTTVRKAVSIIISFIFFSKPFTIQYLWGGILIIIAIQLNLYSKNRSSWSRTITSYRRESRSGKVKHYKSNLTRNI